MQDNLRIGFTNCVQRQRMCNYGCQYIQCMNLEDGIQLLQKCLAELQTRFMIGQTSFVIKFISKDGINVLREIQNQKVNFDNSYNYFISSIKDINFIIKIYMRPENQPIFNANNAKGYQNLIVPNSQRRLTDRCCSIIYIIITVILISVCFYSLINMKDINVNKPVDPDGHICGEGAAEHYPYMYYSQFGDNKLKSGACVKQCPNGQQKDVQCLKNSIVKACTTQSLNFPIYETQYDSMLKICMPISSTIKKNLYAVIDENQLYQSIQKIYKSKYIIGIVCPIVCFVLAILSLLIMIKVSKVKYFYFFVILFFILALIGLSLYLLLIGKHQISPKCQLAAYIIIGIAVIVIILMIINRQSVSNACRLLAMTNKYIENNPELIALSAIAFILWILSGILWLFVIFYIHCLSSDSYNFKFVQFSFLNYESIQHSIYIQIILVIAVLHFIWTNLLIFDGFCYLNISASSYWISQVPNYFKLSLYRLFRYHFGTVAFGSFFISSFSWLTDLLYFLIPNQTERACCSWCSNFYTSFIFQNFLGLFTVRTYTCTALYGNGFCHAGTSITPLLVQNISYVNRAYRMANILLWMWKLLLVVTNVFISFGIMKLFGFQIDIQTIIVLFIVSYALITFINKTYQHTYQTMFITILLRRRRMQKMTSEGFIQEMLVNTLVTTPNSQIAKSISEWYESEKKKQSSE